MLGLQTRGSELGLQNPCEESQVWWLVPVIPTVGVIGRYLGLTSQLAWPTS